MQSRTEAIVIPGTDDASGWLRQAPEALRDGVVHVWRIQIDRPGEVDALLPLLSDAERQRANAFHFDRHRTGFVIAHGMLRRILAGYVGTDADALQFDVGEFGKPSLHGGGVEFNLSHSGKLALLAVSGSGPVGVDVEQWDDRAEHLNIADNFFSPAECESLRALAGAPASVIEGFFSAWSRKEAYLKATGHGISRGLDHFDVTLSPDEPVRLIADRLELDAPTRWVMSTVPVDAGYSAALVVQAPLNEMLIFDAP